MFLIIEGPHNVGKSTLVNKLTDFTLFECRRQYKELLNANNSDVSNFSFGANCAVTWFAKNYSSKINIVFDRLHLSEYAYSILFRNANEISAIKKFTAIDEALSVTNCKMVFLTCDYKTVSKRLDDKNKVYDHIHFVNLARLFDDVLCKTKLQCLVLRTSQLNADEVLQRTLSFIKD